MIGRLVTPALYRVASSLAAPAIALYLARRRARGKEDSARFKERLGIASRARPDGLLIWAHAASVGESLAVLALIAALTQRRPEIRWLVTTGTMTSARLLAERLPGIAFHQFVPVDRTRYVRRFLDHWRPDVALWVESELWPNLVLETVARRVPMALINARLSERAAAGWARWPRLSHALLAAFTTMLAQSEADAARYRALGALGVRCVGNLKYDAPTLGHDRSALERLKSEIGARPLWLAASTHEGEETVALAAHQKLAAHWPDLLTLIAPRHPERAAGLVESCARASLGVARRSLNESITPVTSIYLADTLGELGLFYALSGIVFVGGSLNPVGGHNALEPARLDCALIAGPDMANFADLQAALSAADALVTVRDAETMAGAIAGFLDRPARRAACAESARHVADSLGGAVERTLVQLLPLLPENGGRKVAAHART